MANRPKRYAKQSHVRWVLAGLESPIVYTLTCVTVAVNLFVYGATKIRGGDGLLRNLEPFFGVPYAVLIGAILVSILAINKRVKLLVVILLGEVIHFLVLVSPTGEQTFSLHEHLSSSITIACLLTTACIYYDLVDETSE